ncbi:YqcC family protein [Shewanella avicenniae]|uniref:YqcC family protein n=1 Tax=Shewanella avicenniae TaxID=2814294 RepID=A0ABX7QWZ7_9GAMM|nr:YqcC family protein [Shewanella avicenniae]QSX35500.1 YqcC family protein [Shewanella avicenniae]
MVYQQTQILLETLEQQLRTSQLWSELQPSVDALASTAPFACDTMSFENWLQFIFLPKMQQLLAQQLPLPQKIAIAPMAQQLWAEFPARYPVINTLEKIDALLSQQ